MAGPGFDPDLNYLHRPLAFASLSFGLDKVSLVLERTPCHPLATTQQQRFPSPSCPLVSSPRPRHAYSSTCLHTGNGDGLYHHLLLRPKHFSSTSWDKQDAKFVCSQYGSGRGRHTEFGKASSSCGRWRGRLSACDVLSEKWLRVVQQVLAENPL